MSRAKNKQGVINRDANAATRATLAVQLRAQRLTFEEIAKRTGFASPGAARNAIQRELGRTVATNVEELRLEELDMLNRLHAAVWPLAVPEEAPELNEADAKLKKSSKVSLFAVDRIIAISERRSKLMGLDTPVKVDDIPSNLVVIREVPNGYLEGQKSE